MNLFRYNTDFVYISAYAAGDMVEITHFEKPLIIEFIVIPLHDDNDILHLYSDDDRHDI